MQSPSSQSNPKSRPPSSLACIPCRRRHLKCDAVMPVCSRCQKTGSECRYVRSRRGLRPKLPETNPPAPDDTDSNLSMFTGVDDPFPDILSASALADLEVFAWTDSDALAANPPQSSSHALFPATTMDTPQTLDLPMPGQSGDNDAALAFSMPHSDSITQDLAFDPMLQLFYQGFHRSHPFVLPRRALNTALARHLPESTLSIMRYLGAHFHPDPAFQELYRAPAYAGLADDSIFPGFRVQNLLLLAIAEHAHGSEDSAEHTIQMAISVALEAGMNKASFAAQHSGDSAILEESWRRTYWELYVINGMVAAMRDQKSFILHSQPVEVGLPCDESVYNACNMVSFFPE